MKRRYVFPIITDIKFNKWVRDIINDIWISSDDRLKAGGSYYYYNMYNELPKKLYAHFLSPTYRGVYRWLSEYEKEAIPLADRFCVSLNEKQLIYLGIAHRAFYSEDTFNYLVVRYCFRRFEDFSLTGCRSIIDLVDVIRFLIWQEYDNKIHKPYFEYNFLKKYFLADTNLNARTPSYYEDIFDKETVAKIIQIDKDYRCNFFAENY